MNINAVRTTILKKPVQKSFGSSGHNYNVGGYLLTQVFTDEGHVGNALTYFGLIESGMKTIKLVIDSELTPLLIGKDPHFVRQIRREMFSHLSYYGTTGISTIAISAVDICLWDLIGKAAGVPSAFVLGASRKSVPAYAMVGWYYQGGIADLVDASINAVEEGFNAIKIKVGRGNLSDDIERIRTVRSAVGDDIRIMVDANCAFDESEALHRGQYYQDEGVFWFEEPLDPYFFEGHRRLREKLSIPIAIGENYYTKYQFQQAIDMKAADILQPDNRRAGGVTEWMDIGSIASVHRLKIASHLGGPGNVNVMCAIENVIYLECEGIKRDNEMYEHPLTMTDGKIVLPDVPGMGNEIREYFIEKYRIC